MSETKPIINLADAELRPFAPEVGADTFGARLARLGPQIGARKLGVMLTEVEPGKRAFPFHAHHANEEMFIILEGEGSYRLGETEHAVRAGDVCAAPAGGPETAHQLINSGAAVLRYLSVSTMVDPEVVEYPDSGKFGVYSVGEGRNPADARMKFLGRAASGVDYWDGETD